MMFLTKCAVQITLVEDDSGRRCNRLEEIRTVIYKILIKTVKKKTTLGPRIIWEDNIKKM
jgi:hypothetical protein